ncbi:MAG: hypothetical protein A3F70_12600 [Acidobacteria bacterium RIFCSPLOWO2_12_FULL_67_14]|nr:MAG: hypothetical protein A3H29_00720 [Acidobacteria bacterium RIFCSPLOWO2_02_FULL_67_21]OFW37212.1 MAG: hypothetical protein A3F70_12600 [Acidobacteria bacterium RIFCSPLOWO2_12_FULL_67_14]
MYASAAFEEALAMLEGAESSDPSVRVAVYQCRALSLLALRRDSEAQQEIAAMIAIDPTAPTALGAVPPRFRAMVLAVWLPRLRVIVQQHYAQGKTFFRAGAWQEAAGAFHVVLNLLDYADAGARSDRVLADLRELASEYLALAQDRAGSQDAVPDNPGH